MNKFEDLLQSYLNKDYSELVSMTRRDFALCIVAVDEKISREESAFVSWLMS